MDNQPDVNIVFPINQGIQGECLLRKRPIYAPAVKAGTGFRFPKRLLPQAIDIEAFISYPIYEPPRAGQRQSGKLIGVFTLDSKTPNAYALLIDVAIRATVHEKMEGIAILIGRIYH